MQTKDDLAFSKTLKLLVIGASIVIIVAGMRAAQTLLVPFLLSLFIAVISSPFLFWLNKKGLPMSIALICVIIIVLVFGLLIGILVGSSLHDFSQSLPAYQTKLHGKINSLLFFLGKYGITLSDKKVLEYIDPGAAMRLASGMLTSLGNVLSNAFLILLTVIFILLEAASFPAKLSGVFGTKSSMDYLNNCMTNINQYMVIKTWMSLATGALVAVWLGVLKVDYPILWGLLAFIFNYVPNIGSIIAAVPAILLALIQLGITHALLSAAGYIAFNIIIGNVIEPRFMGKGLGLSTLVVFLSLIFWGWVLGPVGMVLSIPLTMTLKIALSTSEKTSWISDLLGSSSMKGTDNKR
jgi:AI-2 transport protein TqsA